MTPTADMISELDACDWLRERGIEVSIRTLRDMRARGEVAHLRLPRGRRRVFYKPEHLMEAFEARETRRSNSVNQAALAKPAARPKLRKGVYGRLAQLQKSH